MMNSTSVKKKRSSELRAKCATARNRELEIWLNESTLDAGRDDEVKQYWNDKYGLECPYRKKPDPKYYDSIPTNSKIIPVNKDPQFSPVVHIYEALPNKSRNHKAANAYQPVEVEAYRSRWPHEVLQSPGGKFAKPRATSARVAKRGSGNIVDKFFIDTFEASKSKIEKSLSISPSRSLHSRMLKQMDDDNQFRASLHARIKLNDINSEGSCRQKELIAEEKIKSAMQAVLLSKSNNKQSAASSPRFGDCHTLTFTVPNPQTRPRTAPLERPVMTRRPVDNEDNDESNDMQDQLGGLSRLGAIYTPSTVSDINPPLPGVLPGVNVVAFAGINNNKTGIDEAKDTSFVDIDEDDDSVHDDSKFEELIDDLVRKRREPSDVASVSAPVSAPVPVDDSPIPQVSALVTLNAEHPSIEQKLAKLPMLMRGTSLSAIASAFLSSKGNAHGHDNTGGGVGIGVDGSLTNNISSSALAVDSSKRLSEIGAALNGNTDTDTKMMDNNARPTGFTKQKKSVRLSFDTGTGLSSKLMSRKSAKMELTIPEDSVVADVVPSVGQELNDDDPLSQAIMARMTDIATAANLQVQVQPTSIRGRKTLHFQNAFSQMTEDRADIKHKFLAAVKRVNLSNKDKLKGKLESQNEGDSEVEQYAGIRATESSKVRIMKARKALNLVQSEFHYEKEFDQVSCFLILA